MSQDYIAPHQGLDGFHCPFCQTFAHQYWVEPSAQWPTGFELLSPLTASRCSRCDRVAFWVGETLVYPDALTAPPPADDLTGEALAHYEEARSIVGRSPRGAAALLRLALQELIRSLGASKPVLNEAVGELVQLGLPTRVQQSMDVLRVIGNNAVHPGEIAAVDDATTAMALFDLINIVVDVMISQPAHIESLYSRLPQPALDQIERRDGT